VVMLADREAAKASQRRRQRNSMISKPPTERKRTHRTYRRFEMFGNNGSGAQWSWDAWLRQEVKEDGHRDGVNKAHWERKGIKTRQQRQIGRQWKTRSQRHSESESQARGTCDGEEFIDLRRSLLVSRALQLRNVTLNATGRPDSC